jgi:hypothetical protein
MRNVLGRNRAIDIRPIERRRRRNELRRMRRVRVPQNELFQRKMNHDPYLAELNAMIRLKTAEFNRTNDYAIKDFIDGLKWARKVYKLHSL